MLTTSRAKHSNFSLEYSIKSFSYALLVSKQFQVLRNGNFPAVSRLDTFGVPMLLVFIGRVETISFFELLIKTTFNCRLIFGILVNLVILHADIYTEASVSWRGYQSIAL